jgi:hypothetical protein
MLEEEENLVNDEDEGVGGTKVDDDQEVSTCVLPALTPC